MILPEWQVSKKTIVFPGREATVFLMSEKGVPVRFSLSVLAFTGKK
jgi:hypothetical protein